MKIYIALFALLTVFFQVAPATNVSSSSTSNPPYRELGCVGIEKLSNENSPEEIFSGLAKCIAEKDYSTAVEMELLARRYGMIDAERIVDNIGRGVLSVLVNQVAERSPKSNLEAYNKARTELFNDENFMKKVCGEIRMIGVPNYHPSYMIQHGMNVFLQNHNQNQGVRPVNTGRIFEEKWGKKGLGCSD